MGFYLGILTKWSPPYGGVTQDTDFNMGFTKGNFTKKSWAKKWGGGQGYQDRWKCFLPASRTSLDLPGPGSQAVDPSFDPPKFSGKIQKI